MPAAVDTVARRGPRGRIAGALIAVVCITAYASFLDYEEQRVRAYFATLRANDPERYLAEFRRVAGFAAFLAEFRDVEGYGRFRPEVPAFLLGRWALFAEPKRVGDLYAADICTEAISLETGVMRVSGPRPGTYPVRYRLDGDRAVLQIKGGEVPVRLVSYGLFLHHIELVPPGYDSLRYGYLCR